MRRNRSILFRFALVILLLLGQTGGTLHALGHLQSSSESGKDSLPDAKFCGECIGHAQLGGGVPSAFLFHPLPFTGAIYVLAPRPANPISVVLAFQSRAPPSC